MKNHITMGQALKEWMDAHKPRDMSAADYALIQIKETIERENKHHTATISQLEDEHRDRLTALQAEEQLLLNQKSRDLSLVRRFWSEFRQAFPKVQKRPEPWKGLMEVHVWWTEKGIGITYGGLYDIWTEMEAPQ
jgi:hypothetical protein